MKKEFIKQKIKIIIKSDLMQLNTRFVKKNDVLKLVNDLISNTNTATGGDPFWEKTETALLEAIIFYILEEGDKSEIKLFMVMDLLEMEELKLDELFIRMEKEKPNHIAVKQYNIFKMASGKTAKSVLISAGLRLAPFVLDEVN